jgi:hypothetical protein
MTRLPLGSRLSGDEERCEAPMTATDLGAISGERSRHTTSSFGFVELITMIKSS